MPLGRPLTFILTPGNTAAIVVAPVLLDTIAPLHRLLGDKAYDTDAFRALLHERDI
jgi:hypothetical protein